MIKINNAYRPKHSDAMPMMCLPRWGDGVRINDDEPEFGDE